MIENIMFVNRENLQNESSDYIIHMDAIFAGRL